VLKQDRKFVSISTKYQLVNYKTTVNYWYIHLSYFTAPTFVQQEHFSMGVAKYKIFLDIFIKKIRVFDQIWILSKHKVSEIFCR
jgi:hypothetical protein